MSDPNRMMRTEGGEPLTLLAVRLSAEPEGSAEGRELIVLGPSLGTTAFLWEGVAGVLGESYDVVGWDLPGHGTSPSVPQGASLTLGELAESVLALVDSFAPGARFHYAGDSVGGAVGAELALLAPERLLSLTMVCSSPKFATEELWRERAATVAAQGTAVMIQGSAERWFAPGFMERRPAEASRLLHSLRDTDRFGYAAVCGGLGRYDLRARFAEISIPFLAVAGEHDAVSPFEDAAWMAAQVPGGRAVELPGVAHLAPAEAPSALAAVLEGHLRRAGARTSGPLGLIADPYDAGLVVRREVLGDAHVDRATAAADDFTADFQRMITQYAWGGIWSRPGLSRRMRSAAVLTAMIAHGHWEEFAMHVRAALGNGLSRDEIKEVLLQSAIYCGVPAANTAFKVAQQTFALIDAKDNDREEESKA